MPMTHLFLQETCIKYYKLYNSWDLEVNPAKNKSYRKRKIHKAPTKINGRDLEAEDS